MLFFVFDTEGDYDGWQPPTEAEMKLMQARRERSDKISKMMGDYLLKGYKMLGSTCRECDVSQGVCVCVCVWEGGDEDQQNKCTVSVILECMFHEYISRPVNPFPGQPVLLLI